MRLIHSKSNKCRIASRTRTSAKIAPARVEHEALHAFRQSVGELLLQCAAVAQCREIVSRLPAAGIGLQAHVVEAFLEGFEMRVAVAVIIEADGVEIPQAAIDRQIAAPIIADRA